MVHCRLTDIEKPAALRSMFGAHSGAVHLSPRRTTATVTFPDARSLQQARGHIGGGIRGMFKVKPSNAAHSARAAAHPDARQVAAPGQRHSAGEKLLIAHSIAPRVATASTHLPSQQAGHRMSAKPHEAAAKPGFSLFCNRFAFPGESTGRSMLNTAPAPGVAAAAMPSSTVRSRFQPSYYAAQAQANGASLNQDDEATSAAEIFCRVAASGKTSVAASGKHDRGSSQPGGASSFQVDPPSNWEEWAE